MRVHEAMTQLPALLVMLTEIVVVLGLSHAWWSASFSA